jgi:type IV pilus assembly protein PilC
MFQYTAVSVSGVRRKGRMSALTEQAVADTLFAEGWQPVQITAMNRLAGSSFFSSKEEKTVKLKPASLSAYTRQLYQMLRAGVPLPQALEAVGSDLGPAMRRISAQMAARVAAGAPLAAAMAEHPKTFDQVTRSYVAAAEQTGSMVETVGRLSKLQSRNAQLYNKIKSVTAYPKLVAAVITLLVAAILTLIVPKFAEIYSSMGSALPGPTLALINLGNNMIPLKLAGFVPYPNPFSPVLWLGLIYALWRYIKHTQRDNPEFSIWLDKMRYRAPLFGKLNKRRMLFQWASTLSGALDSGLPLYEALELAANSSGSRWQRVIVPELQEGVRAGRPLATMLEQYPGLFPNNARSMIATGETTGELATMLDSVSIAIDDEIDAIVAGLGAKIEVALIVALGAIVGAIVIVLYLPMFNLVNVVQGQTQ